MKRLLRRVLHTTAYHLIIKPSRHRARRASAAGFRFTLRPGVFHPRYFRSSEIFADYIGRMDLEGRRVADVGTGSGVLALAAARAGAASVVAIDVNPEAARSAVENAEANGLGDRVSVLCCDLLSAVAEGERFDAILSNPPFFPGEPLDMADRAWHAGPDYRDVAPLFEQARRRLAPGGRIYLVLSSDADLEALHALFAKAVLAHEVVGERRVFFESMLIYELTPAIRHRSAA